MMKLRNILLCWGIILLIGCQKTEGGKFREETFTDIVRLKTTPVKEQGRSETCWAYAMLATIETEHLMQGDSVNLSAHYVSRMLMRERLTYYYLAGGKRRLSLRTMAPTLVRLIQQYGAEPFNTYGATSKVSYNALCRKAEQMARTCQSFRQLDDRFNALMDAEVGFLPKYVYMASAEYTPLEFAHSVCRKNEYQALTSYTHHPFFETFELETPDNTDHSAFLNLPIDTLMKAVDDALLQGHPVCWEGDISNKYFSFQHGRADLFLPSGNMQQLRQQAFERLSVTDDHCLCLVGIAEDQQGRRYYLAKNSWGTDNPYGGFVYLSADYVRLYTICVVLHYTVN